VSAPVVTSTGPAETHEITPAIDVSGAPEPEVSAPHASELASTGETASTDVTIAPEAAPTPIQSVPGALQAQGQSTALTSELDADTRARVVRVTRALERAGSSRPGARTDAADDLCQVLEAPARACAPTEGAAVHARCHAVIQAAHSIEGLEDEVAEGRRALRRLAASDRDAEYGSLVGDAEHRLETAQRRFDTELAALGRAVDAFAPACPTPSALAEAYRMVHAQLGRTRRSPR
jgi:hypothetical protein